MNRVDRSTRWSTLLLMLLALSGCASTRTEHGAGLSGESRLAAGKHVLLVEPDIELYELLASGVTEPRADWTQTARSNVAVAMRAALARRGATVSEYEAPTDPQQAAAERQIILLHEAVGGSILVHRYLGVPLPSKGKDFDWTLGPGAARLGREGEFGLFIYLRDSYATAGRKAMMAVGLLLGVGVSLGQQVGFASLVDLRSGQIVWFNVLQSGSGDLRNPEDASRAVTLLLDEAPL